MEEPKRIAANDEWQAPPPPDPLPEAPSEARMTLGETLIGIFFEPGRTFESLKLKPRFLIAGIVITVAFMIFQAAFIQKIGYEEMMKQEMNATPRVADMSPEQKNATLGLYNNPAMKAFIYVSPVLGVALTMLIGGLIYWGMANAFGGTVNFVQSLSLVVYSSLPVYVVTMLIIVIVLLLKSADEINAVQGVRGMVGANLGLLIDPKTSPVGSAALGAFDIFVFYGMFLGALGLRKIAGLSSASAWTIVIILWVIGIVFRIAGALISGG